MFFRLAMTRSLLRCLDTARLAPNAHVNIATGGFRQQDLLGPTGSGHQIGRIQTITERSDLGQADKIHTITLISAPRRAEMTERVRLLIPGRRPPSSHAWRTTHHTACWRSSSVATVSGVKPLGPTSPPVHYPGFARVTLVRPPERSGQCQVVRRSSLRLWRTPTCRA